MSQHSQLLAGSGFVPADGQTGDCLAGPALAAPPPLPPPQRVATLGVEPASYLRRAILWRAFGAADVLSLNPAGFLARPPSADAILVHDLPAFPAWDAFLDWVGPRTAIVDVQTAVHMAAASGFSLRVRMAAGSAENPLAVMCHAQDRAVYPLAPAVDITAPPPVATGFVEGDRVHLYGPSPRDSGIQVLVDDEALAAFAARFKASVWGRESRTRGAALLTCPTPAGGRVTLMDLHLVDRNPEPSGSETPALQILLSLLGRSPIQFGHFTVPPPRYADFIDTLRGLTARYPAFASMEQIGRSVDGRDLWLVKIARRPNLPAVLLSNAVHPYEWGPIFGVLRYVRFLLEKLETGGFEAEELLGDRQLWWVPSVCPDGYDDRRQQPSAINLNRNFPGGWEYAALGQVHWGNFGKPHAIEELTPISLRGPGPGSQPETRAMMSLFERQDGRIVTLADFHENTGHSNFLHQFEDEHGVIADADYHVELIEGIGQAFNDRFFEQRETGFMRMEHTRDFNPGRICAWLGYAVERGAKGCVVEACGGDATHYRTVRRTEYAAQMVEQVLALEAGRLYRNPWGEARTVTLTLKRHPGQVVCRIYNANGDRIEETREAGTGTLTRTVPPGGCLRVRYG